MLITATTSVTGTAMMTQIFTDKSYTYLFLPPFLCGILLIDESIKKPRLVRMENRKQALSFLLIQQYIFTAFHLIAWFLVVIVFAKTSGEQVVFSELFTKFARYILSLLIFTNRLGSVNPFIYNPFRPFLLKRPWSLALSALLSPSARFPVWVTVWVSPRHLVNLGEIPGTVAVVTMAA